MPLACTVCQHAERAAIDKALVAGSANRAVARQFDLSKDAVARHKAQHLPAKLVAAQNATQQAEAVDLLTEVRALRRKTYGLLLTAEKAGDIRTALAGVREARACLELLAELDGALDRRPQVNVLVTPAWTAVRAALLAALRPYPEARVAAAAHLAALEAGDAGA